MYLLMYDSLIASSVRGSEGIDLQLSKCLLHSRPLSNSAEISRPTLFIESYNIGEVARERTDVPSPFSQAKKKLITKDFRSMAASPS